VFGHQFEPQVMTQRADPLRRAQHLRRQLASDHPDLMEGAFQGLAVQRDTGEVGRLLQQVHKCHVVRENDDLSAL
jgi:hypothetical protein